MRNQPHDRLRRVGRHAIELAVDCHAKEAPTARRALVCLLPGRGVRLWQGAQYLHARGRRRTVRIGREQQFATYQLALC